MMKTSDEETPEQNQQQSSHHDGVTAELGNFKIHIGEKQLPMVGIFFMATVLLTAVCVSKDKDNRGYGIAVAVVAMLASLVGMVWYARQENETDDNSSESNSNPGRSLSIFLVAWCFVGASVLTFRGPFELTGNGYFACWGMALFSIMAAGLSAGTVQSAVTGFLGSILALGACAVIVICDIASELDGQYKSESVYAMVVSCLTVLLVIFFVYMDQAGENGGGGKAISGVCAIFAILWIVLACLVTFRGPFLFTGNGYFGSWGGAILSVYATKGAFSI